MESPLQFESYSSSEINLILRDLGESETLNVKDLLTKHNKVKELEKKKNKSKSKKELIREKNNKKKRK